MTDSSLIPEIGMTGVEPQCLLLLTMLSLATRLQDMSSFRNQSDASKGPLVFVKNCRCI